MADTGITGTTTGVGPVDTTSTGSFLSGIYKGSVGLGQFQASLIMIIALILGIIMLIFGIMAVFYNDDEKYLHIEGRVMKTECLKSTSYDSKGNKSTSYKCNVTVGYEIDGKKYSRVLLLKTSEGYLQGEPIYLWVDKGDHTRVQQSGFSGSLTGSASICCSILLVGLAYLQYYLTYRYEVYAAGKGVGSITKLFS